MFSKNFFLKLFLSLTIIGISLLVIITSYFLICRNKKVALPKPTGSYAVGRIGYDWVDNSRNDPFSEKTGIKRKLSVWIWYPAGEKQNSKKAAYFPGKWERTKEKNLGFVGSLLQQNFAKVQTNSDKNVPLSSRQYSCQLIIFEPGMGKVVFDYTTLIENLASHGYIVVGVNPTYSSNFVVFSNGKVAYRTDSGSIPENTTTEKELNEIGSRIIKTWTADMSFAIDKLTELNAQQGSMWNGHVNLRKIGAFGHSFGGAASAEACLYDQRIKAGIDIDGWLFGEARKKNTEKPFMFIVSNVNRDQKEGFDNIKSVYNDLKDDGYLLEIPKASHFSFSDGSLFFNPIVRALGVFGQIKGKRGLQITDSYLTGFFAKYLKNKDSKILRQKPSPYPEVKIKQ